MKKTLILFPLLLLTALITNAESVTIAQAQAIAEQFSSKSMIRKARSNGDASMQLAYQSNNSKGMVDYYVFNHGLNGGFVIVSGDDCVLPVLGYADNGTFNADSIPENMQWWLEQYQREIQYARSTSAQPRRMPILNTSVAPLMKTVWDQSAPYNNLCPTYDGGRQHAVTGCVATAVAQIMKTHNWPPTGEGSTVYECNVNGEPATSLGADFSQINFQWNYMRDNYNFGRPSEVQKNAVAVLMSAVGVAVHMHYGASSGAYSINAMKALRDYFRYDKSISFQLRDFHPLDEWEQMLRNEIDAGRPIYYAGQGERSGGHAFVFDGYNKDGYFHVNWGWGGRSDGYFACTALNPQASPGGFNSGQEAIIGIKPDNGGTSDIQPLQGYLSFFTTKTSTAHLGEVVPLDMANYTFLGDGDLSTLDFAVNILNETGSEVLASCHVTDIEVETGYTYYFGDDEPINMTLPEALPIGNYRLQAVYSLDRMASTTPFVRPADSGGYVMMKVKENGVVLFNEAIPPTGHLEVVRDIEPEAISMPADDIKASVVVKSVGGFYDGQLQADILSKTNEEFQVIGQAQSEVSIHHVGEYKSISFSTQVSATTGDTCYVALIDPYDSSKYLGSPAPFVIGEWPAPVPMFTTPADGFQMDFGNTLLGTTKVNTFTLTGEELVNNVQLTITGENAALFRVSPTSISSANVMNGIKVTVTYSAIENGSHEAIINISGGGVETPLTIPLFGFTYAQGDVNCDGKVDVEDVNAIINIILELKSQNDYPGNADLTGDGKVDVEDVNALINIIPTQ